MSIEKLKRMFKSHYLDGNAHFVGVGFKPLKLEHCCPGFCSRVTSNGTLNGGVEVPRMVAGGPSKGSAAALPFDKIR